MRKNQKLRFVQRKVRETTLQLSNGKMSQAAPSVQERFARLARHWDSEASFREAVQKRRWEGREKPSY